MYIEHIDRQVLRRTITPVNHLYSSERYPMVGMFVGVLSVHEVISILLKYAGSPRTCLAF